MKRILLGNRSSKSFGVDTATLQLGHSKSPYSTSVTRACAEPSRWSVGSGGTAKVAKWDCGLMKRLLTHRARAIQWAEFSHESHSTCAATATRIRGRSKWNRAGAAGRQCR